MLCFGFLLFGRLVRGLRFGGVILCLVTRFFLLLFDSGEAEEAELFAESEVFTVCICRKMCAIEMEFAVFVDQTFIDMDGDDIGDEHIVRAHRDDIGHAAGKGQR